MEDTVFERSTPLACPAAVAFAWHERPGAFARLGPPWQRLEILEQSGGIREGARLKMRAWLGPFSSTWDLVHRDYVPGVQFRDVLVHGPFPKWEQLHAISPDGPDRCILRDVLQFRFPLGALGAAAGGKIAKRELNRLFDWRHAITRDDLACLQRYRGSGESLRIVLAGGSGLIGRALEPFLNTQGHEVIRLVRREPRSPGEVRWDPARRTIDAKALGRIDAIINLSGENVAGGRWTAARRERILRSRVDATATLVGLLDRLPALPSAWVNASAIGYYGSRGDEILTEDSGLGTGFLAEACLAWETHADVAARRGVRTAILRFGVVLSPGGGALAKMLPPYRVGLGGPLGRKENWISWIALDDALGAIYHALRTPDCRGILNAVSPRPATNRELASAIGATLHRPAALNIPGGLLRAVFGDMAKETILGSTRVLPERLLAGGYIFRYPELRPALAHLLGARRAGGAEAAG